MAPGEALRVVEAKATRRAAGIGVRRQRVEEEMAAEMARIKALEGRLRKGPEAHESSLYGRNAQQGPEAVDEVDSEIGIEYYGGGNASVEDLDDRAFSAHDSDSDHFSEDQLEADAIDDDDDDDQLVALQEEMAQEAARIAAIERRLMEKRQANSAPVHTSPMHESMHESTHKARYDDDDDDDDDYGGGSSGDKGDHSGDGRYSEDVSDRRSWSGASLGLDAASSRRSEALLEARSAGARSPVLQPQPQPRDVPASDQRSDERAAAVIQAAARGRVGRQRAAIRRRRRDERLEQERAAVTIQRSYGRAAAGRAAGSRTAATGASQHAPGQEATASLPAAPPDRRREGAIEQLRRQRAAELGATATIQAAEQQQHEQRVALTDLTEEDVFAWCGANGLGACAARLQAHGVDGRRLLHGGTHGSSPLAEADLVGLGVASRLHRSRLLALVAAARDGGVLCPWRAGEEQEEEDDDEDEDAAQGTAGDRSSVFEDDFECVDEGALLGLLGRCA